MASSSGTSSWSSFIPTSGSDQDLQTLMLMDQKKRKRMISNRESARRSRKRKQKHMDDLLAQVSHLTKENQKIATSVHITTEHFLKVETENSILRVQVNELRQRLQSLNELKQFFNPWNMTYMKHKQPIMTAANMSQ